MNLINILIFFIYYTKREKFEKFIKCTHFYGHIFSVFLLPKAVVMLAKVTKCQIIFISDFAFDCFMCN